MLVFIFFLILLVLGSGSSDRALAIEQTKIGRFGLSWTENALVFTALDESEGSLVPLEADTTENLLPRVKELGGSATTSVRVAAARTNQILSDLTDGDHTTGWRVYTNTNGAELVVDMGATFILQRIHLLRGALNTDERSLRGYELYANDGDSLNFVGSEPIYFLIDQNRSHGEPELDIRFRPQPIRFLKLRSTGERAFQMGDMEFFGIGVTPFAHYISKVIDLGAPANFGPIEISARIDPKAEVLFWTKTGTVPDDSLYFRRTGIPGEFEEISKAQVDPTLHLLHSDIIRENTRDWSAWSPPYTSLNSFPISPDNRRYLQFEFHLISNGLQDKAIIDSLTFSYTIPALADSVLGEISPATAVLGEITNFTYHLRSVFRGHNRGFDTVFITTPFQAQATAVEVDGQPVDFTQEAIENQLEVVFLDKRIETTDQEIGVHFASLLTVSGTEFRGQVGDSQSDAFPQHIIAGDASKTVATNSLIVGGKLEDRLFVDVRLSSAVITPNGDGKNDDLKLNYILLKATSPVKVEVTIHNLAGGLVGRLYDARDLSGPNEVIWDGRDDQDRLVSPGLYLIRLIVNTDVGETAQLHSIAVVY